MGVQVSHILPMIYDLIVIFCLLWSLFGMFLYVSRSEDFRRKYNFRQKAFLILVSGPFIWSVCAIIYTISFVDTVYDRAINKLD
jgi:hypothetical protein